MDSEILFLEAWAGLLLLLEPPADFGCGSGPSGRLQAWRPPATMPFQKSSPASKACLQGHLQETGRVTQAAGSATSSQRGCSLNPPG